MTIRAEIVAEARTLIGIPFIHQAYSRHGMDCIGVIGYLALKFGIEGAHEWQMTPEYHSYSPQPDPKLLLAGCDRFLDPIPLAEVQPADVLLMRFEIEPMHFALVTKTDPLYVIHALSRLGRVAEHGIDAKWRAYIRRDAYRFRGLE